MCRIIELTADKRIHIRNNANNVLIKLPLIINYISVREIIIPNLLKFMTKTSAWQCKISSIEILKLLLQDNMCNIEISQKISILINPLTDLINDAKENIRTAASHVTREVFSSLKNRDIEHVLPLMIKRISNPELTPETVTQVAQTAFVQTITKGELSITVSLLLAGLKERATPIKRKSAQIIVNMIKLIDDPREAAPFLPELLPELYKQADAVSDPECRSVLARSAEELKSLNERAKEIELHERQHPIRKDVRCNDANLQYTFSFDDRINIAFDCLVSTLRTWYSTHTHTHTHTHTNINNNS
eukprot:GHVR01096654.1.p1 GENE.GHVR01096654.1~~GHVR01096654.1.p1  ORF type:complete len:303 (+),score=101.61 GHVR01096654.1:488-1396(+)